MSPEQFLERVDEVRRMSRANRPRVALIDLRGFFPLIRLADGREFDSFNTALGAYWKKASYDT
jgi:hypothetical protein